MQTEVLRLIHTEGDYEVIVRTQDIGYSWSRFKSRIDYTRRLNADVDAPETYCSYKSQDECLLNLYSPIEHKEVSFSKGKEWEHLWPVFFETCKYQIRILFHGVEAESVPEVRHVRKDVEECFFLDQEHDHREKSLTGELDFVNEPGVFRLEFCYLKNEKRKDAYVCFDVVSPKLDTKNDYASLLREVNDEYQDVIYRYNSLVVGT